MQILEGEHDRLGPRPGKNPRRQRRQLPSPQLLGRKLRDAVRRQRDVYERRDERRVFRRVEPDQLQSVLKIGEAPFAVCVRAEPLTAPFGDRVQGRILQKLRRRPLDPGVRRLAEPVSKLFDQPRLADPWLADDKRELTFADPRALPAPAEHLELLSTPDEQGQRALAAAPAGAARAHDAVERHWRRHAFELVRSAVLGDEEASGLALHSAGEDDRARLGEGLDARCNIGRLAEHLAGRVDHDRPGVEPDARSELGSTLACAPGVEFGERALDRERRAHRALGIVLLRLRVAEQGQ